MSLVASNNPYINNLAKIYSKFYTELNGTNKKHFDKIVSLAYQAGCYHERKRISKYLKEKKCSKLKWDEGSESYEEEDYD